MTDISLAIDFGTSRTKVGWRDKLGEIHIVQWDGQPYLPSVFHLPPDSAEILLGNDALDAMEDDPVGGIENLKRQMIEIGDMELTHPDRLENPKKLVEHLFQTIREQCLEQILDLKGQLPEKVTLTLPAKASSKWRDLLEQGAEAAGFLHPVPVKEPIAAARGWLYSLQKTTATVLVLDCGGGTTDWALVEMNENRLTLSQQHRPESINLGGCDVDRALYAHLQKNDNEQIQHYSAKKLILRLKTYKEAVLSGATPNSLRIGGKVLAMDETVVRDKYQRVFIDSLFISLKPTLEAIENNLSSTQILLVGGASASQLEKAISSITSLAVNILQETGLGVLKGALSIQDLIPKNDTIPHSPIDIKLPEVKLDRNKTPEIQLVTTWESGQQPGYYLKKNIIGFDFSDSESTLCITSKHANNHPSPMATRFSTPNSGLIFSMVGYGEEGQVFIGDEIESFIYDSYINGIDEIELFLGFKPESIVDDNEYALIVKDFINRLWRNIINDGVNLEDTHIIIGYPVHWQFFNQGRSINVLNTILQKTIIAKHFELVPNSKGAAVEAIKCINNNAPLGTFHKKGWILLVNIASTTCNFTAFNISQKKHFPVYYCDEVGTRLIDRNILRYFIEGHLQSAKIYKHLKIPKHYCLFELASRKVREEYFNEGNKVQIEPELVISRRDNLFLELAINDVVMEEILEIRKIIKYDGRSVSWRELFRALMKHVYQSVEANVEINKIEAVFLTGEGAKINFVKDECLLAFSYLNIDDIQQDKAPQFSIASGLARWGRNRAQNKN